MQGLFLQCLLITAFLPRAIESKFKLFFFSYRSPPSYLTSNNMPYEFQVRVQACSWFIFSGSPVLNHALWQILSDTLSQEQMVA